MYSYMQPVPPSQLAMGLLSLGIRAYVTMAVAAAVSGFMGLRFECDQDRIFRKHVAQHHNIGSLFSPRSSGNRARDL